MSDSISSTAGFIQFATFDLAFRYLIGLILEHGSDVVEQGCREVFGVSYRLNTPHIREELLTATGVPIDWIKDELAERVSGIAVNPGTAWERWQEVFLPRLRSGRFTYTYAERLHYQLSRLISLIQANPTSRRAILSVWNPISDSEAKAEVPCTVISQYAVRDGALHSIYYVRSNDCVSFLVADVYLYVGMQAWLAEQLGYTLGTFSHVIGSLHIYSKDLARAHSLLAQLKGGS